MSLTNFLKATGNEFATVADEGIMAGDISGWVDTGSYALNALVSGSIFNGFPGNRIVGVGAAPATGKSFFALAALNSFLRDNPSGLAMIYESESALTRDSLIERGIDTKRVGIVPVTTVQEFRNQAIKVLDNYEKMDSSEKVPLFLILDSMGMLSTTKEIEDVSAGSDTRDMTRTQLLKGTFRVLTLRLGRAGIPMIVTNHTYDNIGAGPYGGQVNSGGSGLIYASSNILGLSKAKEKDGTDVTGVIITVTNTKSRITKENLKVKCRIKYDGGLDRYFWLTELAEEAGIFKKVSTRYELPDGTKVFGKTINDNPKKYFDKSILTQIDEYVNMKFKYAPHKANEEEIENE